jgi:hypothetical protein
LENRKHGQAGDDERPASESLRHGSQNQWSSPEAEHEAGLTEEDHLLGGVERLSYLIDCGCES